MQFVFETGVFCLLSSLLNNLTENVVYHIATLNIVFFKTRFSQCNWEKSVIFLILKTLFPRPFMLEQTIFISHFLLLAVAIDVFCVLFRKQPVTHTLPPAVPFLLYTTPSRSFLTLLAQQFQLTCFSLIVRHKE